MTHYEDMDVAVAIAERPSLALPALSKAFCSHQVAPRLPWADEAMVWALEDLGRPRLAVAESGAQTIPAQKGGENEMFVFKKGANWFIRYRLGGRRVQERIGPSKALAEKVHAKRVIDIAEGRFLKIPREKRYRLEDARPNPSPPPARGKGARKW